MCDVLGVSPSEYYAWLNREPSVRDRRDAQLTEMIKQIHKESYATYGSPRIHAELKARGVPVGKKRLARLTRQAGLRGVCRRRYPTTTVRNDRARPADALVDRQFDVDEPDQLWVADITNVPAAANFLCLAVVLDACTRRVVGWSMADHLRSELVVQALDMALERRDPDDVIHHSDQGRQYTSITFGHRCKTAGVRPSMGSVGDCYANAMCESFFATLECELHARTRLDSSDLLLRFRLFGQFTKQRCHSGGSSWTAT